MDSATAAALTGATIGSRAIRTVKRAIDGAVLLEGERGEAAAVAEQLLDCVRGGRQSASV
jgi:hypothetical protein